VVLSLDGRPEINDANRKLNSGGESYAFVLPKIKKIVESRGGKNYYIRGTFTRDNLDFASDILHMADLGFTELSMEPVVAKESESYALKLDDLPAILKQYELLTENMRERNKENRGFKFYHFNLNFAESPCVYKRISGCGVGTEYLAVTPNGDLYPCHQFVGDDSFIMGDIWRGVNNTKLREKLCESNIYSRDECKNCWARLYCSGGCAANAYNATGDTNGIYELGCEMFKKRIECAIYLGITDTLVRHSELDSESR
jgi:uncharacterized protein